MGAAIEAVNAATDGRYRRRVGYGSSMGAFAALAFSASLRLDSVIAISPQYSIDRRLVGFETRWAEDEAALRWTRHLADGLSATAACNILYDPFHLDAGHVALIRALRPLTEFRLPFSGHPSGNFLNQIGLLPTLIGTLIRDDIGPAAIRPAVRRDRRSSPAYWSELSRALGARHSLGAAFRAITEAVRLAPGHADHEHARGHIAMRLKRYDAAVESFGVVASARPERARCHYNLALAQRGAGLLNQALEAAQRAFSLEPTDQHRKLLQDILSRCPG